MFERFKLEKRVSTAEEALEKLKSEWKRVETEWEMAYDKMKRLMWRLNARAKFDEEPEEGANAAETVESLPGESSKWTPQQQEHQRRILAQRGRNGVLPR